MVGALGEAEDLVQETFLRAWRGRPGFDGRAAPRAPGLGGRAGGRRAERSGAERRMLRRYVDAHRTGDRAALAALLAADVRVQFPPLPLWVDGREPCLDAIREHADPGTYRYAEAAANHQPAFGVYLCAPGAGLPLFDTAVALRLVSHKRYDNGILRLIYVTRRPARPSPTAGGSR
ncbi:hypothetical protein Dvina_26215 [Dactylosporangium vinaceum]|nr:sigma factor [Dactylosporangium vinaceum]UAC01229.1 hypothetical protein Dvina_26215 [Dactylosporangium vinaceum]